MSPDKDPNETLPFSFSDIVTAFKQSKQKIIRWALYTGLFGVFLSLLSPVKYEVEGTFREKSNKAPGLSTSSFYQMFSQGATGDSESEAISMIKSRKCLKHAVDKMNLQGSLNSYEHVEGRFRTFMNNLKIFYAKVNGSRKPALKDFSCPLKIESLTYTGEISLNFNLTLFENGTYDLYDLNKKKIIGTGKLGQPFRFKEMEVVIVPENPAKPPKPTSYLFQVSSLSQTVDRICDKLTVESVKNDKSLLKITYSDRNRYKAEQFLNEVMAAYQVFLKDHHNAIAVRQLDYLNIRRECLTDNLCTLMQKHANFLSGDLYSAGFIDTDKEMEFLVISKQNYKEKLLANELEIKRLEGMIPGNVAYYDRYSPHEGDPAVINTILGEIRALKQSRDSFRIELQKKALYHGSNLQKAFEKQLLELNLVQSHLVELKVLIAQYEKGEQIDQATALFNDPRFLLKEWFQRLENSKAADKTVSAKIRENLKFYLNNLERLFEVHEHILQERLTHQQNPSEYQGINLELAKELFLGYSKQLIQNEGMIRQNLFFINQMKEPEFEITSLSSGLNDPVSIEIIRRASDLVLNLRDQNNQSPREQERIKDDLNLQRTFLAMHLQQTVQLMELTNELIEEKIYSLQNLSLELLHQQISLLEQNLNEYVHSRLQNLQQEKKLIEERLEKIHFELSFLPDQWVSEKLLQQEVQTNQLIVEEIAKMVESKNITHNLEVIQSSPVDAALIPLHPKTPSVLLWGVLGLMLGGSIGSALVIGRLILEGIRVSPDNLKLYDYHVSGSLSIPSKLETLRHILAYFTPRLGETAPQSVLLIENGEDDYSAELAELLLKRGERVIRIDLNFGNGVVELNNGLLSYLEGKIAFPVIQKGVAGEDVIPAGGMTLFGTELISSHLFEALLEQLEKNYQWILAVSPSAPLSAEAVSLLKLFSLRVLTIKDEKIEQLQGWDELSNLNSSKKTTFVFAAEEEVNFPLANKSHN